MIPVYNVGSGIYSFNSTPLWWVIWATILSISFVVSLIVFKLLTFPAISFELTEILYVVLGSKPVTSYIIGWESLTFSVIFIVSTNVSPT